MKGAVLASVRLFSQVPPPIRLRPRRGPKILSPLPIKNLEKKPCFKGQAW